MEGAMTAVPEVFDPAILAVDGAAVRFLGTQCPSCGVRALSARRDCPACGEPAAPIVLASHGTIRSFTVVSFPLPYYPSAPAVIVQVRLDDGVRVQGFFAGEPRIGDRCEIAPMELQHDAGPRLAYRFVPAGGVGDA